MPLWRTAPAYTNIGRLDTCHNKHWPRRKPTKRRCCVCSARGVTRSDVQMCQVWRGAWCGPKLFHGLPHKGQLIMHLFVRPPYKELKPRLQWKYMNMRYLRVFFRKLSSLLGNKDTEAFLRHAEECLFPSPQSDVYFTNVSRLNLQIFRYFEKHAQNWNTSAEQFDVWGLTVWI